MRQLVLLPVAALAVFGAEQVVKTRTYDVNGDPVPGVTSVQVTSGSVTSRSVLTRSVNGRQVPVENVEEAVVSDSGGVRIVERTVRRYDANGRPGPPERTRIETRTEPTGSTRTTTVMRGDINGRMQLAERSVAVTRSFGENSDTTVVVERPMLNAGFEVVERREESVRAAGPGRSTSTSVVQRQDTNGRMIDTARTTVERTESPAGLVENRAEYESASTGEMRLMKQVVARTVTTPDGSVQQQVDTFEPNLPGQASSSAAGTKLTGRQVIETTATPTGTVQTVSFGTASPSDPGRIGSLRPVEQTVCIGECGKKKP